MGVVVELKTSIMLTYLRYALATFCFAASVGCLGLWWRSVALIDVVHAATVYAGSMTLNAEVFDGLVVAASVPRRPTDDGWFVDSFRLDENGRVPFQRIVGQQGQFGSFANGFFYPLWYPALIFALAGVGVLRFRRQYSIRSALICVSVVALLLGMAVAL